MPLTTNSLKSRVPATGNGSRTAAQEQRCIELGETKEAVISYVYFEPLASLLTPGFRYEVREGNRLVGFVEIVEVDRRGRG